MGWACVGLKQSVMICFFWKNTQASWCIAVFFCKSFYIMLITLHVFVGCVPLCRLCSVSCMKFHLNLGLMFILLLFSINIIVFPVAFYYFFFL
ncbi:hypothetical protein IFM89_034053 [Coptis chinensis]|uniref:Uncharacterized protein n=1 Tax=Coptis chinensis TaxID=261450 RepID=A0A835ITJ9_9MAGN|nr:hypothetical protein IFM89_034053 [Coptis chinensis]